MKVRLGPYRKNRAVNIEIEPHDTWNMDETLAHIIHPMLIQLKQTKHGSPVVDEGDLPLDIGMSDEAKAKFSETGEVDGQLHARWDWVLDEMIWAFEQKILDADGQPFREEDDFSGAFQPVEDEYYSRISNAFRLFGKYYEALWD